MIEIIDPGLLTTVQDVGRPGYAALGVPPSGAVDRQSLIAANALVGNPPGMACLETTLTGVSLRLPAGGVAAVTGARAVVMVDGVEVAFGEQFAADPGAVLEVGPAAEGVRSYLAFAGGLDAEPVLGSRSTDLLTGLGPQPLASTVTVPFGPGPPPRPDGARHLYGEPGSSPGIPPVAADPVLRVVAGPRADRFDAGALDALEAGPWTVSPRSNRIGVRIEGEPLAPLAGAGQLRSEGIVTGSIQVPPSGLPTVMLNDRPTTGGYPVIAVVIEEDLRIAGQLRPGSTVRFSIG